MSQARRRRGSDHVRTRDDLAGLGEPAQPVVPTPTPPSALGRSLELEPGRPRVYHLLGRVLDRLGRNDEATRMYRMARESAAT